MDKFTVGREQLITALSLFLDDRSPVSVHTHVGAAFEMLGQCCRREGKKTFFEHIQTTNPERKSKELRKIQNQYRNAFKHYDTDNELAITNFSDVENDVYLLAAIQDYETYCGTLTIPMQVFDAWFFSIHPDKLVPEKRHFAAVFPRVAKAPRTYQKLVMRNVIAEVRLDRNILLDPRTELD